VQNFAVSRSSHPERWRKARRGLLCVVVLLNALGICCNLGAAFYYNQAADANVDSASAYAANNAAMGKESRNIANLRFELAGDLASIQRFSEVSVLMLTITAFSTVGVFSAQVIATAMRTLLTAQERVVSIAGAAGEHSRQLVDAASQQGRQLQRKVIGTFVFVFVTVLERSVFIVFYAVAQALSDVSNPCAIIYCDPCHNVYTHIHGWVLYTPAFQQVTTLIASPIALLVALWGMSDVHALEQSGRKSVISRVKISIEMNSHNAARGVTPNRTA